MSSSCIHEDTTDILHRQTAVVRGAAIRGLGGIMVKSRRCRRHYGFQLDLPYDPNVDDVRHKYVSQFNGKSLTRGTMVWKVKKARTLSIVMA